MADEFRYRVNQNEPAILVELFLPKRMELQVVLCETLRKGFRLDEVRRRLREIHAGDGSARGRFQGFASGCWSMLGDWLSDAEIEAFPRLFHGYTLYEVEGVYLKCVEDEPGDPDGNWAPEEETTQVVRLIFKYDCAHQDSRTIDTAKAVLRDPFSDIAIRATASDWLERISIEERRVVASIAPWIRYVGWFLYGYFLYALCEAILRRSGAEESEDAVRKTLLTLKQDEIWVTSLWNLNVGMIELRE